MQMAEKVSLIKLTESSQQYHLYTSGMSANITSSINSIDHDPGDHDLHITPAFRFESCRMWTVYYDVINNVYSVSMNNKTTLYLRAPHNFGTRGSYFIVLKQCCKQNLRLSWQQREIAMCSCRRFL